MVSFPNAKINIGLYITARRADGYHDIVSVMAPVDWCDILEIVPAKGTDATLTVTGRAVDCPPEKNLVMKAYHAVAGRYDIPAVDIYLHKVIPDGAGLGGGSSDAAFTVTTLNRLFNLGMTEDKMAALAATLGSDCPFFIYDRPMMVTGTGTTLSPFELDLKGYNILIVKPDVHVSTAEAYGGCQPRPMQIDLEDVLQSLTPDLWEDAGVTNDFEKTVFPLHPAIREVKRKLQDLGVLYASMSGSGASVFGIFKRDIMAEQIESLFPGMACHISKF